MKWLKPLYVGEHAHKNKEHIIKGIEEGKVLFAAYAIILAHEDVGSLEIIQATLLKQKYYHDHEVTIVGIAASRKEAIDIVLEITKRAIEETGSASIRDYIERGDAK